MIPLRQLDPKIATGLKAIYTDIDDTLTTEGRLPACAYAALWKLHEAGLPVVLVTGRPAGWCDHFARMWPVAGVIGENGAFYFRYDEGKLLQRFLLSADERQGLQKTLKKLERKILKAVPGAGVASDQPYRIHDLAIDFCEDVPALDEPAIDRIVQIFEQAGAVAKVSSIHVNGWFGDYNKLSMIRTFHQEVFGASLESPARRRRALYVGDSPNDEPAFAYFRYSVGVANIRRFESRLQHPPSHVTQKTGGEGFAELTRRLLRQRALG